LKILVVATKTPWPTRDGGRLLLAQTLAGLAAAGLRPTLVAPWDSPQAPGAALEALSAWCEPWLVPARPAGPLPALARALAAQSPYSVARHTLRAVRREVARRLAAQRFDLVHAEQLQALPQTTAARGLPVVLRAQNVESDLWGAVSRLRGGWRGRLLALEASRLAAWEGAAVRQAAATAALTERDARRLAELSELAGTAAPVRTVAAPFTPTLPPGPARLFGDPPVVVLGGRGWLPNEEGAAWFRREVWPGVRAALPGAVLHLFGAADPTSGGPADGVVHHPAPEESESAFGVRAILVVPLRIASGVRMKILEAWARGVPVVGTPEAVAGLGARHGCELLVAQDPGEMAAALVRLHREPGLARSLVAEGRAALRTRHDPAETTTALLAVYEEALRRR
jgi:polysaccharide biosynthesis protein PslH